MRSPLPRAERIGLVPTMGAIHAGHLALFDAARAECDTVVASLFVNPAQFGDRRRPRRVPARPRRGRARSGGRRRRPAVRPGGRRALSARVRDLGRARGRRRSGLEGEHRPGHFRGVATVCLKLFTIVRPRRRLLRPQGRPAGRGREAARPRPDLELEIRVVPTVRDPDGLALSSRNGRLSPEERHAGARDPARARDPRSRACPRRPRRGRASSPSTSPSPTSTARRSPSPPASAPPA